MVKMRSVNWLNVALYPVQEWRHPCRWWAATSKPLPSVYWYFVHLLLLFQECLTLIECISMKNNSCGIVVLILKYWVLSKKESSMLIELFLDETESKTSISHTFTQLKTLANPWKSQLVHVSHLEQRIFTGTN